MKYQYSIQGMTCNGCASSVKVKLEETLPEFNIYVLLQESKVIIEGADRPALEILKEALPNKYTIEIFDPESEKITSKKSSSKLKQLRPLFLIFGYILIASILLHLKDWSTQEFMLDFMGLFYIVFSFFKFLDLKGFVQTFKMYDPLARQVNFYALCYPFIEVLLGLLFLCRFEVKIAALSTLVILSITTLGVVKTLLNKQEIQCACLGTVLKLKMTEATFIENTIMIFMALIVLL